MKLDGQKLMALQHPEPLRQGDRIGMVAPASPFDINRFYRGIEVVRRMGFEPVYTDRIFHKNGYFAGSPKERAREINDFFASPDIRALWAVRGGYGSLRLLPEIDYGIISKTPKIFIGSSDITALLVTLHSRCAMPVFHGPVVASLADTDTDTIEGLARAVGDFHPLEIRALNGRVIREGRAEGPVLGGNLATLCHLLATPYAPDFTGCILFVEDIGEKPYRIDRMLTQMKLAGCFDGVAGIAAGSFKNCGPPEEVERVFADLFSASPFPVVAGFPAGHGIPNMTLPFGISATLDSGSLTLSYHGNAPVHRAADFHGAGAI
ncbi:MAG: LD-carboxypeptidase [Desulfobacteraceae bacterium]|nr:LD-carboxypeptidase [Desulfobacteraceae bacterium]